MENEKTVEELVAEAKAQAKAEAEAEWKAIGQKQVNEASKAERLKYEKELEKAKLTESERLAQEQKEKWDAIVAENTVLKTEKSTNSKKSALNEAKLPSFYLNDNRLINAKDEEVQAVLKVISKEHNDYLASLGKTTVQSTTPNIGTGKTVSMTNEELTKLAETNPDEYRRIRREQKNGK